VTTIRDVMGSSHPHQPGWTDHIPGPRDPLPRQLEEWLEWLSVQRNRPATTVRAYRQDIAKFVAFLDVRGPDILEGLDRSTLRCYQVELADVLPHPRTRARALVALRSFLRFSCDEGWTDKDLARQITIPRFVMADVRPVQTEDVPRLLAALPTANLRDLRDRALVHFLLSTGCRIAEACSLDLADFRLSQFRVLGKGGKYRTVYCTVGALAAVQDYLQARGPDPSPALFISVARKDLYRGKARPGNRLSTDGARMAFTALRERLSGDPEAFRLLSALHSPHVLRHTAATTLLEATDGDVRLVQEVLGHATLGTMMIYTEITDRRKRDAYVRLGDYLRDVAVRVDGAQR
jgi:integrase/recombinase XerD